MESLIPSGQGTFPTLKLFRALERIARTCPAEHNFVAEQTLNRMCCKAGLYRKLHLVLSSVAIYYSYLIVTRHRTSQIRIGRPHRGKGRSRLSRQLLIITTLSLCGSLTPTSNARTPAEGPEVVMALTKRDFGDVFAGEELEQNFPIRNAGTKPLELERKSTLGSGAVSPGNPLRAAIWRTNDQRLATRTAGARRAAPS